MRTPNLNNYVRLLNEVYSKGKIDGTMIVKNHVNSRSIKSMKNLKFVDSRGLSLFQSQPTLNDIKKILRENRNQDIIRKQERGQTKLVFDKKTEMPKVKTKKVTAKAPLKVAEPRTTEINLFWGMIKIKR
jgi:hypothetical protein